MEKTSFIRPSVIGNAFIAISLIAMTSCEKINLNEISDSNDKSTQTVDNTPTKNVKFKVTNITVSTSPFDDDPTESTANQVSCGPAAGITRASLSDAAITDLYIYAGDTLLVHQLSTDSDFGQPNIKMKHGRHELAFIATKGTTNTVTSSVFTPDKVKDTFCKYVTLNVTATTLQQSVSLERYVAGLKLTTEDATSAAVSFCVITYGSYGKGLLLPSLTGIMEQNRVTIINIPEGTFANTGIVLKGYLYTPNHGTEFTTSIQIDFKDSNGQVLFTHTIPSVPFITNRFTNIHGKFFSNGISNAISLTTTEWSAEYDVSL